VGPRSGEEDSDTVQPPPFERELQLGLPLDQPARGEGT
jgi:hypothetical protein